MVSSNRYEYDSGLEPMAVFVRIKVGWWPSSSTSPGFFIAPLTRTLRALLNPSPAKPKIAYISY